MLDYSLPQLEAFAALAAKQRNSDLAQIAGAVRAAFHADKDEWAAQIADWTR